MRIQHSLLGFPAKSKKLPKVADRILISLRNFSQNKIIVSFQELQTQGLHAQKERKCLFQFVFVINLKLEWACWSKERPCYCVRELAASGWLGNSNESNCWAEWLLKKECFGCCTRMQPSPEVLAPSTHGSKLNSPHMF